MAKRKLQAKDIFSIQLVGDVARHPSEPKTAVVVQRLIETENTYQSHIWLVSTEDGKKTLFTNSEKSETAPAWSPDGQWLAFLSNRGSDTMQLYVMPEAGGEAIRVTDVKEGVQSFQWSPDGMRIGFLSKDSNARDTVSTVIADTTPSDGRDSGPVQSEKVVASKNDEHESPREKFTKDVRHIRRRFYRLDGVGFFGSKRSHLFVVELANLVSGNDPLPSADKSLAKTFVCTQITNGEFDIDSFDFSPDGTRVVVSTNVDEDAETTFKQFLYLIELPKNEGVLPVITTNDSSRGAQAGDLAKKPGPVPVSDMQCLTPFFHTAAKPRFSSDGRFIAFKGEDHQHGATTLTGLYLYDIQSRQITWLTKDSDELFENRSIADTRTATQDALEWSVDGKALCTLLTRRGTTQLVKVAIDSGQVEYVTEGHHCVLSYSFSRDGKELVYTAGTSTDPANVYRGVAEEKRKLTHWNEQFLTEIDISVPERFEFDSDGLTLDGWIMLPSSAAPAGGYPAVLQVHGGPAMMYADAFFFEFQLLAASGLAVVYTNPRGSVGYGQEFCSCIEMDWGNLDFRDVEKLMDTALERFPLNSERLGIAGGSYGGFMSAWAIGHTKRYKAAVVMRAVINWYSMMASDIGYATPAEEFGGMAPWDDPERYMRISPITYVGNVETSTLIVHSENDYRCPIDQGEQFYIALKLRGVPVEFLRFPEESHGLSRSGQPWHRVVRLEEISRFLSRELNQ
ncbi:S9 family peptidase [Alicyclobacillus mengziensis]|uniref:S9 family peptidase n=1 Tax=Alicyclobacillus mengziensis TaxID=2931921 RepID=A0A9X7Z862_9BACL|nr:S9 family peptidase [Alicyclobacillus mengziensis]QSO47866.1 S9 family peptidase [Alicyclobacillus mengziensis]